jgi:hypothetical protein
MLREIQDAENHRRTYASKVSVRTSYRSSGVLVLLLRLDEPQVQSQCAGGALEIGGGWTTWFIDAPRRRPDRRDWAVRQ